jgi:hypothetical protein
MRDIGEKYRLRGEANFKRSDTTQMMKKQEKTNIISTKLKTAFIYKVEL